MWTVIHWRLLLRLSCSVGLLATTPSIAAESTNYEVPSAGFVMAGGLSRSEGNNYSLRGLIQSAGASSASADYAIRGGLAESLESSTQAAVLGEHVFYNASAWDGYDPAANPGDDAAIAPDKTALLPGAIATFANYTSYVFGINGIMVDIDGLPGVPGPDDFRFKTGNNNLPETWSDAPAPRTVALRRGAGLGGSDRVTFVWEKNNLDGISDPNEAVAKQWIQVTILATENTGLADRHAFYFGNAVGEAGNRALDAKVDPADELLARANPRNVLNPAPLDSKFDYNRDKRVDPADELIARVNATSAINALRLFTIAAAGPSAQAAIAQPSVAGKSTLSAPSTDLPAGEASLSAPRAIDCALVRLIDARWVRITTPFAAGEYHRLEATSRPGSDSWSVVAREPRRSDDRLEWLVPFSDDAPQQFFRLLTTTDENGLAR